MTEGLTRTEAIAALRRLAHGVTLREFAAGLDRRNEDAAVDRLIEHVATTHPELRHALVEVGARFLIRNAADLARARVS